MVGQVEEHMWKPPVLIPSEEEGCEVCGVGKAELLLGKRLSPRREWHSAVQRLALAPTADTLAARLGARAPEERLGSVSVAVCVNAVGWRPEIQEPPCHVWVSPGRRCACLRGMSPERG